MINAINMYVTMVYRKMVAYFIRRTAVRIGRPVFAVFVPLPGPILNILAAGCGVALN